MEPIQHFIGQPPGEEVFLDSFMGDGHQIRGSIGGVGIRVVVCIKDMAFDALEKIIA